MPIAKWKTALAIASLMITATTAAANDQRTFRAQKVTPRAKLQSEHRHAVRDTRSDVARKSEAVGAFAGEVTCDLSDGKPRSKVRETRLFLSRPIRRNIDASGLTGIQVGGFAGLIANDARSHVSIKSSGWGGPLRRWGFNQPTLDFTVSLGERGSRRYKETGHWRIGVDSNGKATLRGRSIVAMRHAPYRSVAKCRWKLRAAQAPTGPHAYDRLARYVANGTKETTFSTAQPPELFSNCGAGFFGVVTDGLYAAAAITGYYEEYKVATMVLSLSAVGSTAGGQLAGALCPTAPLTSQNLQLAVQQAEIENIEDYLGLLTNAFYAAWYQLQLEDTTSAAYNWNDSVNGISPQGNAKGLFGNFMDYNGVGLWNFQLQPAVDAPTSPQQLALNDTAFNNAKTQVTSRADDFQEYVKQLSGTDIVVTSGGFCTQNDCSSHVVPVTGSNLIQLYEDLLTQLRDTIDKYAPQGQTADVPAATNQNIVPLYDDYNTMLVNFYWKSVNALGQAMMMEWTVNQMNFFRATSTETHSDLGQIGSWGAIPGTSYRYQNQSLEVEIKNYNTAQVNLARAYTARLNQLYLNTLNYMVTDVPVTPQFYPVDPISYTIKGVTYREDPIKYAAQVGKSISASTTGRQGRTPLSLVPQVANGAWQSSAVIYQFIGMRDVATCVSNVEAYNQANGTSGTFQDFLESDPNACPAIFKLDDGSALNQSVYDGNTLQPYTSYQAATGTTGGPIALAKQVVNNLKFCDPTNPGLYWDKRGPMVNCGKWYVPQYLAKGFPRANVPAPNGDEYYWQIPNEGVSGYTIQSGINMTGDCSNNLSFKDAKYPAITTLYGDWPSGEPSSCDAVIPSVQNQTPTKVDMRTITGNYDTGNTSSGCSMGWFGSGLSRALPNYDVYYYGADELQFGLRLPRGSTGGDEYGGWVLPLRLTAGCSSKRGLLLAYPRDTYGDPLSTDGYFCTESAIAFRQPYFSCTLVDGSTYVLTLKTSNGNGTILEVRLNEP